MSKARKLADLLDSAGDVAGGKIADDTINSEHFVDGGIDDAHIDDVAATKLTGTIADARFPATLPAKSAANLTNIPAANITGTLPAIDGSALTGVATDLTSIRNDIATLALHSAVADNKAAYNLPSSFIDQFEDDTGLATQTDVDRNASEYVSSVTTTTGAFTSDSNTLALLHFDGGNNSTTITDSSSHNRTITRTVTEGSRPKLDDGEKKF